MFEKVKELTQANPKYKTESPYKEMVIHVLELAKRNGWTIIDMEKDWKSVFPE
ncbi:hypothetical protein [Moheibacter lacus]|uniref:Uncharacterized protein n=1 Tax=Moheibacter lacus TaxID=2745851 RepID=A0A838ZRQ9_9FLAO|nr:hypothetical protein [Moheibacter lacus]MBA5629462.1 hypothetical protein [Moheibacter lacus]